MLISDMQVAFDNTQLVRVMSFKVKVKYQGYISQKMAVSGALVFHKHILLYFERNTASEWLKRMVLPFIRCCISFKSFLT